MVGTQAGEELSGPVLRQKLDGFVVAVDQQLDAEGFLQLTRQRRQAVVDGRHRDGLFAFQLVALVEHVEDVAQADFTEVVFAVDSGGLGQAAALAVPQNAERSFEGLTGSNLVPAVVAEVAAETVAVGLGQELIDLGGSEAKVSQFARALVAGLFQESHFVVGE